MSRGGPSGKGRWRATAGRRCAGAGLLALGTLLALGAVYVQLALALPLRELPTRPGVVDGLVCVLLGALLSAAGRGWLSRRGAATRG